MPRKPRIEYAGAVYHVMCRGDRREAVFCDDRDNQVFSETLSEACERCGWAVHAHVLMKNHYHMLLETPEANLVAGMYSGSRGHTQHDLMSGMGNAAICSNGDTRHCLFQESGAIFPQWPDISI